MRLLRLRQLADPRNLILTSTETKKYPLPAYLKPRTGHRSPPFVNIQTFLILL